MSSSINDTLNSIESFVSLARDARRLIVPQYRDAETELCKIVDKFLLGNQMLLKWINAFEVMDLKKETVPQFTQFYKEYKDFRNGPDYHMLERVPEEVASIYNRNLAQLFMKWFGRNNDKLASAGDIFNRIYEDEADYVDIIYGDILRTFEVRMEKIYNRIRGKKYTDARRIQEDYLNETRKDRQRLVSQTDELNNLLQDYMSMTSDFKRTSKP